MTERLIASVKATGEGSYESNPVPADKVLDSAVRLTVTGNATVSRKIVDGMFTIDLVIDARGGSAEAELHGDKDTYEDR